MGRLESYLKAEGIWHRFIDKEETVHTKDASQVTGIELRRITKNLACRTSDGECVLLIIPGDRRVDLKAAADALRVKNVSLLSPRESESVTGYPPGGTPSIGHDSKMRAVLDRRLLGFETVFCGGGRRDKLLELRTKDVLEKSGAVVADICSETGPSSGLS
ncbi:MAG: aminoacyl-tRNA deacylase [Candidatus Brockarchaeota archaeon]|nr:aminoacyl-tRNA deacylase [Candidatus Brockarchaeota archaeon]